MYMPTLSDVCTVKQEESDTGHDDLVVCADFDYRPPAEQRARIEVLLVTNTIVNAYVTHLKGKVCFLLAL